MSHSPELTKVRFAPAAVSVLMPVYNRENYVIEAIRSIEAQNFRDYKLIIYDDGSTDKTEAVCRRMADGNGRIQYVRGGHVGVAEARNILLDLCESRIACWQDSDDISHPLRLQLQFFELANIPRGIVFPRSEFFTGPFKKKMDGPPESANRPWWCGQDRNERPKCVAHLPADVAPGFNCGGGTAAAMFTVDKKIRFTQPDFNHPRAKWMGEDCSYVGKLLAMDGIYVKIPQVVYWVRDHDERMSNIVRTMYGKMPDADFAEMLEAYRRVKHRV